MTTKQMLVMAAFAITATLTSCQKGNLASETMDSPEKLNESAEFAAIVVENQDLSEFLYLQARANNIDLTDLTEAANQINLVLAQNLNAKDQKVAINKVYGADVSSRLERYQKTFISNWRKVKARFGEVGLEDLKREYMEVLNAKRYQWNSFSPSNGGISKGSLQNVSKMAVGKCAGFGYSLCIIGAGAAAVLCHASCDTTALATTAGLGIPACLALCATVQAAASAVCYKEFCSN